MPVRIFALLFAVAFSAVNAQTFPGKTMRLVSGVTPGSASDTMARVVAEKMSASRDHAARAEAVFDDHRHTEACGHLLGDDARHRVGGAARRDARDETHGFAGEGLRIYG